MKKRLLFIAFIISTVAAITGCGKYNQAEIKLRDEGIAAMDEGNYEEAIQLFDKALGKSIGKVTDLELDIDYYKAAAQFAGGQFEDAATTYTYLIRYDSKNYKPYFLRGSIYAGEGEIGKAIKDYDAAVAIDEKNYLLYIEIYNNLNALGYNDQGLVYLNNALGVEDKSDESKYYKGRIYYMLGQNADAERFAGVPLFRHRPAVKDRGDGRRRTGTFQKNCRDQTAGHAAEIQTDEQRDAFHRLHAERHRKEQDQCHRGTESGDCSEDNTDHDAQKNQDQADRVEQYHLNCLKNLITHHSVLLSQNGKKLSKPFGRGVLMAYTNSA